jgi:hypothetical protein
MTIDFHKFSLLNPQVFCLFQIIRDSPSLEAGKPVTVQIYIAFLLSPGHLSIIKQIEDLGEILGPCDQLAPCPLCTSSYYAPKPTYRVHQHLLLFHWKHKVFNKGTVRYSLYLVNKHPHPANISLPLSRFQRTRTVWTRKNFNWFTSIAFISSAVGKLSKCACYMKKITKKNCAQHW